MFQNYKACAALAHLCSQPPAEADKRGMRAETHGWLHAAGIGPEAAALCVTYIADCASNVKELIYTGTAGWSAQASSPHMSPPQQPAGQHLICAMLWVGKAAMPVAMMTGRWRAQRPQRYPRLLQAKRCDRADPPGRCCDHSLLRSMLLCALGMSSGSETVHALSLGGLLGPE